MDSSLTQRCINTIRMLAADGVQKANSGRAGMPMGAAAMAFVLWTRFLRHNPATPRWPDRDRFVLSAGLRALRFLGYAVWFQGRCGLDLNRNLPFLDGH